MTTETSALVRQMRELMREFLDDYDNGGMRSLKHYARPMNEAITAADEWLAQQPKNLSPAPPLSYEKSPTVGNPWGDC